MSERIAQSFERYKKGPGLANLSISVEGLDTPIWSLVDYEEGSEGEEKFLSRLLTSVRVCRELRVSEFEAMKRNYKLYHGEHYTRRGEDASKLTINVVKQLLDDEVNRIMKYRDGVAVVPQAGDFDDRINAELVEKFLESKLRDLRFYYKLKSGHESARVFGECFYRICWNDSLGGLDPVYRKKKSEGRVEVQLDSGETVSLDIPVYQGDVDVELYHPWEVGLDYLAPCREKVNWCYFRDIVSIEELKADYPDYADRLQASMEPMEYGFTELEGQIRPGHVTLYSFYHRRTKYLPGGLKVIFTPDVILEKGDIEFPVVDGSQFGELPLEQLTDAESPGDIHGWSRIELLAKPQAHLNNVFTLWSINLYTMCHPKVLYEEGTVDPKDILNKAQKIGYRRTPPTFYTPSGTPAEIPAFAQALERQMNNLYNAHPISRGETGSNVRSATHAQFLEAEQEESEGLLIAKHQDLVLSINRKVLAWCAEFYDKDDERFVKTVSDRNKWQKELLDVEKIQGQIELELQVSTGLPRRKDSRMQAIMQQYQLWPQLWPADKVVREAKLGALDDFMDSVTAARETAAWENYQIKTKGEIIEPNKSEDLFAHWDEHFRERQSPDYKSWPDDRKRAHDAHLRATEYLMEKMGQVNPHFAQKLLMLPQWPVVHELAKQSAMAPQQSQVGIQGGVGVNESPRQGPVVKQGGPGDPMNALTQGRGQNGQFGPSLGGQ